MKRPWQVKMRYRHSITGNWCSWHVHGTYTTEESALCGASRERERWARAGHDIETQIIGPTAAPDQQEGARHRASTSK